MLSTRNNGLPTKLHATLDSFNSDLIRLVIDGKKYLLDATDKLLPFGMIPFEYLNGDGRVFDFIKGSYWEPITPLRNNFTRVKMNLLLNEENIITGTKEITKNKYHALYTRDKLKKYSFEDYVLELESKNPNIEIKNYSVKNLNNLEKPIKESFDVLIDYDENSSFSISDLLALNKINPFKLKERKYPVDYGYIYKNIYTLSLKLSKNYKFDLLPDDLIIALPNKGGSYIQKISLSENRLNIYLKFQINKTNFSSNKYQYLKQFYNNIIKAQNTQITFKNNL